MDIIFATEWGLEFEVDSLKFCFSGEIIPELRAEHKLYHILKAIPTCSTIPLDQLFRFVWACLNYSVCMEEFLVASQAAGILALLYSRLDEKGQEYTVYRVKSLIEHQEVKFRIVGATIAAELVKHNLNNKWLCLMVSKMVPQLLEDYFELVVREGIKIKELLSQ